MEYGYYDEDGNYADWYVEELDWYYEEYGIWLDELYYEELYGD